MQLNPEQQKVVNVEEGPILVLAGAGTGKTRTLTARATRLIQDGLPPNRLLLLTFTNKAAGEMKERMVQQIGSQANKIWAGTFHSIASKVLHRHAHHLDFGYSFTILDDEDSKSLMKRCIKDGKLNKVEGMPAPRVICHLISKALNTGETLAALIEDERPDLQGHIGSLEKAAKIYKREKKKMDSMDFDDLLKFWVVLLRDYEEVRDLYSKQFKHILVDEYQDTNRLQNQAIRLLATHHRNITAVGDDHQSIYAFRGAQFENILEFEKDWPGCQVFTIEQNYRSSPQILQVANASIANNIVQRSKNLFSEKRTGSKPVLKVCQNTMDQAKTVISDLTKRKFSIPLEKMVVLYRAHHQSMELQIELARAKIPFRLRSGIRFFEMAHIKDVLSFLKWKENPKDRISFSRFMCFCPGLGSQTSDLILKELLESNFVDPLSSLLSGNKRIKQKSMEAFRLVQECLRKISGAETPSQAIEALFAGPYRQLLLRLYEDPEKRIDDLTRLSAFAMEFTDFTSFLNEVTLVSGEKEGNNKRGIILSTIHQAKGLEWNTVFLLGLYQGGLPISRAQTDAETEEERRLFYVAVTRAKRHLLMYYPRADKRIRNLKPSIFLTEIQKTGTFGMVKTRS